MDLDRAVEDVHHHVGGDKLDYAKNGSLTDGDGLYGGGDSCLFSGFVNG